MNSRSRHRPGSEPPRGHVPVHVSRESSRERGRGVRSLRFQQRDALVISAPVASSTTTTLRWDDDDSFVGESTSLLQSPAPPAPAPASTSASASAASQQTAPPLVIVPAHVHAHTHASAHTNVHASAMVSAHEPPPASAVVPVAVTQAQPSVAVAAPEASATSGPPSATTVEDVAASRWPRKPDGRLRPTFEHAYGAFGFSLNVEILKTLLRIFMYLASISNVLLEKVFSNTLDAWIGMTTSMVVVDVVQLLIVVGLPGCRRPLKQRAYKQEVFKMYVLHLAFQILGMASVVPLLFHVKYDFQAAQSGDVLSQRLDELSWLDPLPVSIYVHMTFQDTLLYAQKVWLIGICASTWLFVRETPHEIAADPNPNPANAKPVSPSPATQLPLPLW